MIYIKNKMPSSCNSMARAEYFDDKSKIFHRKTYNIKNNNKQVGKFYCGYYTTEITYERNIFCKTAQKRKVHYS